MKDHLCIAICTLLLAMACNTNQKLINSGNAIIEKVNGNNIQCQKNITTSLDALTDEKYTILFLVRHAEKIIGTPDPGLLPEGMERAKKLATILEDVDLNIICSSPFIRTRATVIPVAELKKLDITNYSPEPQDQNDFFSDLLKTQSGSRILVVGHSNTIPKLLNHFAQSTVYNDIDENEYDNFYIVALKDGVAEISKFKY